MKSDLEKAKEILKACDNTCVLCKGETVYASKERGVKPLIEFIDNKTDMKGFSAADRIAGTAAAMLYALLGVKAVYASVMSESAAEMLDNHKIVREYGEMTAGIINREGNGICPMEEAVLGITDPGEGLRAIKEKIEHMRRMNKR
ncbi:MAG: DUF1893 domain-containing protein [Oscillospiraceae bacterium]|nr:DUF1893 domain-containing protein [Oscillospiraceae bacterium]